MPSFRPNYSLSPPFVPTLPYVHSSSTLSLSLLSTVNAWMLNVIDTKSGHRPSIYPPFTPSFMFLALAPPSELLPFYHFDFFSCHSSNSSLHDFPPPLQTHSFTLALWSHPSFHCFSLSQSSSDSQTKTFAPWNPHPPHSSVLGYRFLPQTSI